MKKIILLMFILCSPLLYADYILVYSMDPDKIQYTYKNISNSIMTNDSEDGLKSVYVINDDTFLVTHDAKGTHIKKANNLKVKKRVYDTTSYIAKKTKPNYKIKKTKRRKKVAGIDGEIWMVYGHDDGQVYSQYVVVTNDPIVVKVMRNMFIAYSKMDGQILDLQNIFEIEPGYMLIKTDSMRLKSFAKVKLSPNIYALPSINK